MHVRLDLNDASWPHINARGDLQSASDSAAPVIFLESSMCACATVLTVQLFIVRHKFQGLPNHPVILSFQGGRHAIQHAPQHT